MSGLPVAVEVVPGADHFKPEFELFVAFGSQTPCGQTEALRAPTSRRRTCAGWTGATGCAGWVGEGLNGHSTGSGHFLVQMAHSQPPLPCLLFTSLEPPPPRPHRRPISVVRALRIHLDQNPPSSQSSQTRRGRAVSENWQGTSLLPRAGNLHAGLHTEGMSLT